MKKLFFIAVSLFVITSVSAQRARPQTDNARAGRNAATVSVRGARTATRGAAASGTAARQRAGAATARAARAVGAKTARTGVVTAAPTVATTTAAVATTTTTTKAEEDMTAAELTAKFNEQMKKVEAVLDVQSQCQQKFNECMDNFCKDENVGRCLCSASYSSLSPVQNDIKRLTEETNQLLQEQLAKAKMTDKERVFYEQQKIALEVAEESSAYGSMTIDSLKSGMFTGKDTGDFSNKTGSELFTQAKKSCQPILDACPSESSSITSFYQSSAGKECNTALNNLNTKKDEIQFARNKAEFEVKNAAYKTLQKKLDNVACLTALKDTVQQDALCGSKYATCLNCNEEFSTGSYDLILENDADPTDTTSNWSKKYTGCAATNIQNIMAKKEVFNTVLDTCSSPAVAWNTFMIDFATQMEKAAKDQKFVFEEKTRENEFDVADTCQKEIDECLLEICGSGYLSCTGREKAAQYNLALIDSKGALEACQTVYSRCDSRVKAAGTTLDIENIWNAAWSKAQNQADQTYQKRLATLITETGNVEKAQAKMEGELAEAKARSENIKNRIDSVLSAENTLADSQLGAQIAEAKAQEAKNQLKEQTSSGSARGKLGCERKGGTWEANNCCWEIIATDEYVADRNFWGKKSYAQSTSKDKVCAGAKYICTKNKGCTSALGNVNNGEEIKIPTVAQIGEATQEQYMGE